MIGRIVAVDYSTGETMWERDVSAIVAYAGMGDLVPGAAYGDALSLFLIRALALAPDETARLAVAELARDVWGRLGVHYNLLRFEPAPVPTNPAPPPVPVIPDDPPKVETTE